MKKALTYSIISLGTLVLILSFTPVLNTSWSKTEIYGTVKSFTENSEHDLELKLYNNKTTFYINRFVSDSIQFDLLRNSILNNVVKINYSTQVTVLDPLGRYRHVFKLSVGNTVLYTED